MSSDGKPADRASERAQMVGQISHVMASTARMTGVEKLDPRVRAALLAVPRHHFVLPEWQFLAYADETLSIGQGQTISQPFIVALMTQLAHVSPGARVLEVGTGSAYQAAILAELAAQVYSVEVVPELANRAASRLRDLDYQNVETRNGDGFDGWPEQAPFDAILVTAATRATPAPLIAQLAVGGRMLIPIGEPHETQQLVLVMKREAGEIEVVHELPVAFVPLTRQANRRRARPLSAGG